MKVGVVKEIKADEYRVALTPAGARELVQRGHEVLVETGAGEGSSFADDTYEAVGARTAPVDEVWAEADLLLKVKEPLPSEYPLLRPGARPLHLSPPRRERGADPRARRERRRVRRLRDGRNGRPRAAPARADERDRRAGSPRRRARTSSRSRSAAAACCSAGSPASRPAACSSIGGGIVGYNAAVIALGLGASVTILERSIDRMRHLDDILSGRVSLIMSSTLQIEESIVEADVVIGAVLIPGAVAPGW